MKKTDYVTILDILIDDGVMKSIYIESTDNKRYSTKVEVAD